MDYVEAPLLYAKLLICREDASEVVSTSSELSCMPTGWHACTTLPFEQLVKKKRPILVKLSCEQVINADGLHSLSIEFIAQHLPLKLVAPLL